MGVVQGCKQPTGSFKLCIALEKTYVAFQGVRP